MILKTVTILYSQFARSAIFLGFICICIGITILQLLGKPLYFWKQNWYHTFMRRTKRQTGIACIMLLQWLMPSDIVLSGDKKILSDFEELPNLQEDIQMYNRFILIVNHQISTDWLYIWWIAYIKKIHDGIYIILKDSLRKIPVIGWGMKTFGFIFLSRSWSKDYHKLKNHLEHLSLQNESMLLLLYPEGTNFSSNTKPQSLIYAKKKNLPMLDYVLLPRIKGLYLCLMHLNKSTKYLYNCTIGYQGVMYNEYAQDIFTFKSIIMNLKFPENVHIHFQKIDINKIPLDNEEKFKNWLYELWIEKDKLMHQFFNQGYFSDNLQ
ncbi:unnamed protein product [Pneumocystis jirovecii]|uniref:Phospholipid/glycerol acyltransferase domain-containing protein n=1 Tax=Pneumocystis jirovecii TaxID=42068 RepID=L0P984_PNEJI|nr:unnamed protein product [Pneumocystis jirovecii]